MRHQVLAVVLALTAVGVLGAVENAAAQAQVPATAVGTVVPIRVSRPEYPAIASAARVAGVVIVNIGVRPDGQLESAAVLTSVPLLDPVVLQAVRSSAFECRGCTAASTPYTLVFAFELEVSGAPLANQESPEGISVSPFQSRIRIVAPSMPLIPYFASYTTRSAKCLYLWQCGVRWGGLDYYYYPVYSSKCLWLWRCGWRERA